MNLVLSSSKIRVSIVKTTGPSIARLLFRNNDSRMAEIDCIVCNNEARNKDGVVVSNTTGKSYKIPVNLTCRNGGIYIYEGGECDDQYTGKTTVATGTRFLEHLRRQKTSSVYKHRISCRQCQGSTSLECSIVEDYRTRGKYTLSEREYLWNYRIKGVINSQKTLLN